MSLLLFKLYKLVPPIMNIYPFYVAIVRWKDGILKFISSGIIYHLIGSFSFMLLILTKCKAEFVPSKKCKNGST